MNRPFTRMLVLSLLPSVAVAQTPTTLSAGIPQHLVVLRTQPDSGRDTTDGRSVTLLSGTQITYLGFDVDFDLTLQAARRRQTKGQRPLFLKTQAVEDLEFEGRTGRVRITCASGRVLEVAVEDLDRDALYGLATSVQFPPQPTRPRSRGLALAGALTAVAGLAWIFPRGQTYRILGDEFCVTTYAVDSGRCTSSDREKLVGMYVLIAGGTMLIFGLQRVTVSPMVSHTLVGARATVQWGGTRR